MDLIYLHSVLDYNKNTGLFTWKKRLDRKSDWNTRWNGKKAGGLYGNGYFYITLNGKDYLCHRLAWFYIYGRWPLHSLDHINGNPKDNRIDNLREATQTQNLCNRSASKNNLIGLKGVSICKHTGRWVARIHVNKKKIWLGRHKTPELAHAAYIKAAKKYHGEFARF